MNITEEQLQRWGRSPSETEEGKCQNAVRMITEALNQRFGADVSVFLQGSYRNRTNIRQDSDVDVVVLHTGYYFPDVSLLPSEDQQTYWSGFSKAPYSFSDYKAEVLNLMEGVFGAAHTQRKNKCIRIAGNDYRVNADVVPCFVHRRIGGGGETTEEGVQFLSDSGDSIFSFPKQHYDNGVAKNGHARQMYKPAVRILKNVRNGLVEDGKFTDKLMPSFLLECLVWNVLPHTHFHADTHEEVIKNVLVTLFNDMNDPEKARQYAEVSDLKWLLRGGFNAEQAKTFVLHAWDYMGYEN